MKKSVIKYIQFPFSFSTEKLVSELNGLKEQWILHFNKAHYDGEWSAMPLRSINGSLTNVLPENRGNSEFKDTVLMDQCPYIKSITSFFNCEHKSTRLLKLKPGAHIKEHRDGDLAFEYGEARIHVPITTNPQVELYLDNELIALKPGECWYMNFNLPHRLANNGDTDRVHLVMDIIVNGHVREMFEKADGGNRKFIEERRFSKEDSVQIIRELKNMKTPVSMQLAKEIEDQMEW